MVEPLKSVGAQTLMETPLPPITWLVDGLLATGTTVIFASRPKIGKSWAVLQLGHCIATGKPFLERTTTQAGVIYLALEDTLRRLQSRLWSLDNQSSDSLKLVVQAATLEHGLIKQMEQLLKDNPNIKLFIVDTLQVTRDQTADYSYATDYSDLRQYKEFADQNDVCVVLVHHLRKAESRDDDMLDISGTSAISGAVDQMMVLKKKNRADTEAKLSITGRDVEYTELIIERKDNWWTLVDTLTEDDICAQSIPEAIKTVANYVYGHGEGWSGTITELMTAVGLVDYSAPILGKQLAQHADYLASIGINYNTKRTAKERLVALELSPREWTDDSYDGYDGYSDSKSLTPMLSLAN